MNRVFSVSFWMACALSLAPLSGYAQAPKKQTQSSKKPKVSPKSKTRPKKTPEGVRKQFAIAQGYYAERKFEKAVNAYSQILRTYPGYIPAMIQMARALYRLDRIPEAHSVFARLNPIAFDAETSYEYGLSHFWMRQYDRALYGLRRVPTGHSLFDLANYYGGIAALKLNRLIEAEAMMTKAQVLPIKLSRSRRNYLDHIAKLNLLYEKKGLAEDRKKEREKIKTELNNEKPIKLKAAEHPNIQEEQRYVHKGFQGVSVAPEVGVIVKNQVIDNHGYSEERNRITTGFFQFRGGPIFGLPYKVGSDQAAIGLQLIFRAEEQNIDGVERRNVQTDDLDDIQRIQTTEADVTNIKYGSISLEPWVEFPSSLKVWFALGGKLVQKYPDFERENQSGLRAGYLRMGSKEENRKFNIKFLYGEITDADNKKIQSVNTWSATWTFSLTKFVGLDTKLLHQYFVYELDTLDGPTSATSLTLDLYDELPYGFSIGFDTSSQYQSQNIVHDLPTFGDVSADGQVYTGGLYLQAKPVDWFSLQARTQAQKSVWSVEPVEAEEVYQQNTPDFQQDFIVNATVNLLF